MTEPTLDTSDGRYLRKVAQSGGRHFIDFTTLHKTLRKLDLSAHVASSGESFQVPAAKLVPLVRLALGQFSGGVTAAGPDTERLILQRGFASQCINVNTPDDTAQPAEQRFERAWFGGYAFDHFGHFLLEGLSRIAAPELLASGDPVVFFDPMRIGTPRRYMADLFQAVGLDPARVVFCNRVTDVGVLQCCEPAIEVRGRVRPQRYEVFHRAVARRIGPVSTRNGIIYLSRSRLQGRRSIAGETEIEAWLAGTYGAKIVYPEMLSIDEQLQLQSTSALIIGCEGSALHLPILLGTEMNLIALSSADVNLNYFLCDEIFAGTSCYIRASTDEAARPNKPWTLDLERVKQRLSEVIPQLLQTRPRSPSGPT